MGTEHGKQRNYGDEDWTPEESSEVFERAAQLQSEEEFADESRNIDRATLDKSAGRAGIDEKYVKRAVEELRAKERDAAEQKRLLEQARVQRKALVRKIALPGAIAVGLYLMLGYSSLNNKLTVVDKQQQQLETVLQRRHNLIPNIIAAYKAAESSDRRSVDALSQLQQRAKGTQDLAERAQVESQLASQVNGMISTMQGDAGQSESSARRFGDLAVQMEGAENRIAVERRRYNDAVAEYNRVARGFPLFIVRPLLGFPGPKPLYQADSAAREAPKF